MVTEMTAEQQIERMELVLLDESYRRSVRRRTGEGRIRDEGQTSSRHSQPDRWDRS